MAVLPVLLCFVLPGRAGTPLRPESFGASGDGLSDDAPAFNRCFAEGRPVALTAGKTYRLKTRLQAIHTENFELQGNGARLIVDADYPLDRYAHIFHFDTDAHPQGSFVMTDLQAEYLPGQKFADSLAVGDSYFIFLDNCRQARLSRVSLDTPSRYNNLTFFATFGTSRLEMEACSVRLNTLSRQGGCVWVMNRYCADTDIRMHACRFEHDARDEAVCFAAVDLWQLPGCRIRALVEDCTFRSACTGPSSGFLIHYNHAPALADIRVTYRRCRFEAAGRESRKILSCQTGEQPGVRYAVLASRFEDCVFDYRFSRSHDTGLLGLPFRRAGVPVEDCLMDFRRCRFTLRGIRPLIGDRDGERMGCYRFRRCRIDADAAPFTKQYNVHESDIYLGWNRVKMKKLY